MTVKGTTSVLEWFHSLVCEQAINYEEIVSNELKNETYLILKGTTSELERMEELVTDPEADYECEACPVWEACREATESEMNAVGSCSHMVWQHIETIQEKDRT